MSQIIQSGPRGPQGVQGIQGIQGIQGETGPQGPNYPTRTKANIAAARNGVADGEFFIVGQFVYKRDDAAIGADSAAADLGEDGVVPGLIVTPFHYGSAGDGVTDDHGPLSKAIAHGRTTGKILDGQGQTFRIMSKLTEVPGLVAELSIDASSVVDSGAWVPIAGAYEAPQNLTADTRQGKRTFGATAHGYAVGDIVLVQSNLVFELGTNAQCAHWGRIAAVTADTFTTHEASLFNLLVADGATVRRLPKSARCRIEKLTMKGGPSCKNGLQALRFTDIEIVSMQAEGFEERGLLFIENYSPKLGRYNGIFADAPGLGYGIGSAGNGWPRYDLVNCIRHRHGLTFGASGVIPSVGGTFGDVLGTDYLSGAIDTHPATVGVTQTGRTVVQFSDDYASEDGIVWQGVGGSVFAEISGDISRHTVLLQPSHVDAAFDVPPSYRIEVSGGNAGDKGVAADLDGCGNIGTVEIVARVNAVNEPVYVDIGPISVEEINISGGGISSAGRGVRIICEATSDLGYLETKGRWQAALGECVYLLGQTDAGSRVTEWSFPSGKASGGTYGVRATNKVAAKIGVPFLSGSTGETIASGGATIT